MNKKFYLIIVLTWAALNAYAQVTVNGLQQSQGLDANNRAYGYLTEIKAPEKAVTGTTYLNDNWLTGSVEMTNGLTMKDLSMRYDILTDNIEVNVNGKLSVIRGQEARSIVLIDPGTKSGYVLINGGLYEKEGVRQTGFFRVVMNGNWSLLEKIEVVYEAPNYNQALGTGNQAGNYAQKSTFYIAQGTSVFQVVKNNKKFMASFPDQRVAKFIKEEHLSLKQLDHLELIVDFLNKEPGS